MRSKIKHFVQDRLEKRAFQKFGSSIGWRTAPMYARYHRFCQRSSSLPRPERSFTDLADQFRKQGIVALSTPQTKAIGKEVMERIDQCREDPEKWIERGSNARGYKRDCVKDFPELKSVFEGDLGRLLEAIYESHYKLFYGVLKHSFREHGQPPAGSQLWHSDAGPGSCINVMFLPNGVSAENGALQAIDWSHTSELLEKARKFQRKALNETVSTPDRMALRKLKCDYYEKRATTDLIADVHQPIGEGGMFVLFRNNCIHKGGFPAEGFERFAFIFHFYPADRPPNIATWFIEGRPKTAPYPQDPAF